jgi:hypothetical protein
MFRSNRCGVGWAKARDPEIAADIVGLSARRAHAFAGGSPCLPTRGHGAADERLLGSALCPAPLPTLRMILIDRNTL